MSETSGQYRIEAVLGRGGFGTVYRATFEGGGGFTKRVALKVLNSAQEDFAEHGRRLRDEARMMGLLRHRAVVRADQLIQLDGRWAVVMEFVEGVDLEHLLSAGPVPPNVALEIIAEVAGALHAALETRSEEGTKLALVHRDLKPSNVMITRWGEIKVMDFGGAKADFAGREGKTQNFTFGSINYMAPERLDFRDCPGSDIYALGCILYELVTGRAFGRSSANPERHEPKVLEALRSFSAHLQPAYPELVELLGACLAGDPDHRPTAQDLEQACFELGRGLPGPRLRYWAEEAMDKLDQPSTVEPNDNLTGTLLRAQPISISGRHSQPHPAPARQPVPTPAAPRPQAPTAPPTSSPVGRFAPPPSPPPPRQADPAPLPPTTPTPSPRPARTEATESPPESGRKTFFQLGAAAVLAVVLGLGLGGTILFVLVTNSGGPQPAAQAPAATPPSPAATTTQKTPAPTSTSTPTPTPTKQPTSQPQRTTTTTSTAPKQPQHQAPAPKPINGPSVKVTGDASRVQLAPSAGGAWLGIPGRVPTGSYDIYASFDGGDPFRAGQLTVSSGSSPTVHCSGSMYRCTGR